MNTLTYFLVVTLLSNFTNQSSIHTTDKNIDIICAYLTQKDDNKESSKVEIANSEIYLFNIIPTDILQFEMKLPKYLFLHYSKPAVVEESIKNMDITNVLNALLESEFKENSNFILADLNGVRKNSITIDLSGKVINNITVQIIKEGVYPTMSLLAQNEVYINKPSNVSNSNIGVNNFVNIMFSVPIEEGLSSLWSGCELVSKIKQGSLSENASAFLNNSLSINLDEGEDEKEPNTGVENNIVSHSTTENTNIVRRRKTRGIFLVVSLMVLTVVVVGIYIYFFLNSASRQLYKRKISKRKRKTRGEHKVSLSKISTISNK